MFASTNVKSKAIYQKLNEVLAKLKSKFDEIRVCENDIKNFVNAKKDDLELEIYQSENLVVADLWKGDEEFNNEEFEVKEVKTYEEAINLVINWMNKNNEK